MELLLYFLVAFTIFSNINCRVVDVIPKPLGKKLFLSRHVVTDSSEFDGGVLVSEEGVIEAVLERDVVNSILANNLNDFKIIDGGDLALMAGVVDSHVHVNEPGRTSWEGYSTATQAAAAGGVTTIIDMPLNSIPPTTTLENLKVKAGYAKGDVFVDVGFWGGVVPGNEIELHDLIRAGVVGFKCFLSDSGVAEFPMVTESDLAQAFTVLNGTGSVLAFHAEMSLDDSSSQCTNCSDADPTLYTTYLASRPDEMEIKAVSLITSFIPKTDLHVHVVHVSAEGVVPILEKARSDRIKDGYKGWRGGVTAETCNQYLTLSSEMIPPGHSEYKCSPPVRNITNKQKLWEYIKDRRLDLVVSDHSPSVADLKGPNFMTAWGGISSVQFDLPLFWTEAKARGLSLSEASHYLSAGPARLAGLQDRKGAIRPGLDADLIFFDPNASFVVTPDIIRYKNKISPYMYRVLTGTVEQTYLRGRLIYGDGDLISWPQGKLLLNDEIREMLLQSNENISKAIETESGKSNTTETKMKKGIDKINFDKTNEIGQTLIQGEQDNISTEEHRTATSTITIAMLSTSENKDIEETTLSTKASNKNDVTLPLEYSETFDTNYLNDTEIKTSNKVNSPIHNVNGNTVQNTEKNEVDIDLDYSAAKKNATLTRSLVAESGQLKRVFYTNNTTFKADFISGTVLIIFIIRFLI